MFIRSHVITLPKRKDVCGLQKTDKKNTFTVWNHLQHPQGISGLFFLCSPTSLLQKIWFLHLKWEAFSSCNNVSRWWQNLIFTVKFSWVTVMLIEGVWRQLKSRVFICLYPTEELTCPSPKLQIRHRQALLSRTAWLDS